MRGSFTKEELLILQQPQVTHPTDPRLVDLRAQCVALRERIYYKDDKTGRIMVDRKNHKKYVGLMRAQLDVVNGVPPPPPPKEKENLLQILTIIRKQRDKLRDKLFEQDAKIGYARVNKANMEEYDRLTKLEFKLVKEGL